MVVPLGRGCGACGLMRWNAGILQVVYLGEPLTWRLIIAVPLVVVSTLVHVTSGAAARRERDARARAKKDDDTPAEGAMRRADVRPEPAEAPSAISSVRRRAAAS